MSAKLTHLNERGEAHIVDIGGKAVTIRRAVARAVLEAQPATIDAIIGGTLKKGDALAVARIAGIMAAKKTHELIPLCHPLMITKIGVDIEAEETLPGLRVSATVKVCGKTGVEMEALTAVTAACLTIYDMAKAVDRGMVISDVRLMSKSGGKSGAFLRV